MNIPSFWAKAHVVFHWILYDKLFFICCVAYFVCFFFIFVVQVEVEMELVVENYVFTEELKNKSSPVYIATEKNFTTEVKHPMVIRC